MRASEWSGIIPDPMVPEAGGARSRWLRPSVIVGAASVALLVVGGFGRHGGRRR